MFGIINPHFISLCASAWCALIQIPLIIPTVDPITFLRGSSDILTAKIPMLISYHCQQQRNVTRKRCRVQDKMQLGEEERYNQSCFFLLPLILCLAKQVGQGKKSRKPGVKISRRQEWNENHKWELPSSTKTHLIMTCMKKSRLRWASSHGWFGLLLPLLKLKRTFLASPSVMNTLVISSWMHYT